MKGKLFAGICLLTLASVAGQSGRDAVQQRGWSVEAVGIANPGFETGREAWIFDRGNYFVATNVAHTGERSVCIAVKDARKDGLYVKRHVPIDGGGCYSASCYVKTQDVRESPCEQGSVGAGLIVEWLDKDRKWIGTGDYACGLWGTADWREVSCPSLKAPPEAGFAVIFLALRGAGRAWFDDVTFSQLVVSAEKTGPADGSEIACNTPLFTWKESPGARGYSVVVSSDPAFGRDVRTWQTDGLTSFRLTERLAPGTWYWKVTSPGREDAAPWKFVQTAPLGRDCLPPEVLTPGGRVLSADGSFEVVVRDNDFKGVGLVFEGRRAVERGAVGGNLRRYAFLPPPNGWPSGLTTGPMRSEDGAGNVATRTFHLLNARRPENAVTLDADGFYRVGGRRFFPLSIYEVQAHQFGDVRSAGYDLVHCYAWEGSQDDVACRAYLDGCWSEGGLRAFIGFDRGQDGNGLMQGNEGHIARRVGALADHPGLFCWYLYDEPEVMDQYVSPPRLKAFADLIRALDPYHPVAVSTWNNAMVGVRAYRPAWDVHWMQAYGTPDGMLDLIGSVRRRLVEPSPQHLIVGCNDGELAEIRKRGGTPDPDRFSRDYDQLRACAYMGVVMGFDGLSWWWYGKDRQDFYSAAQSPKAWRDLAKVVGEMRTLKPLLESEGAVERGEVSVGQAKVLWWVKTHRNRRWLIALNTSASPVSAEWEVPGYGRASHSFGRYGIWRTAK